MPDPEVVLITGTRKGIGRHLAEHFVQKGALVVGCSRSEIDWEVNGQQYAHYCLDVVDEVQVRTMLSLIRKRYGRLDILINNAGIASMNHTLLTPVATLDRIMDTNFCCAARPRN
jgi:3-oxoacyl-[acyl-carrier protein] reductase